MNPLHCIDFYKADHRRQYPEGTQYVYSNFTPRSSINGEKYVIWFGLQYVIKYFLIDAWNNEFFKKPKKKIIKAYKRRMDNALGKNNIGTEHIEALHDLGYLPIRIKALPEGSLVGLKIPVFTIKNTLPEFFWLTNYLETALSCLLWKMTTSATTAFQYKQLLTKYAKLTNAPLEFVNYQAHDFSFRGMSSIEDAAMSGAGHLTSFYGSDTVPAIDLLEKYYNADSDKETVGVSIPATEHSVMCAGEQSGEFNTFKRLITEVYPEGNLSIVSDTWDLWKVLDEYLPALKDNIVNRKGRLVIRPDSGDPVEISVEVCNRLYNAFPGARGRMHDNLGVIYGDSITLERCERILASLAFLGLTSDNMVFGVGSYTYQYKTRDNLGFAMKATWARIRGEEVILSKDPVTDNGNKKSAKGLLKVEKQSYGYILHDQCSEIDEKTGELKVVFIDGELKNETSLKEIRKRVEENL